MTRKDFEKFAALFAGEIALAHALSNVQSRSVAVHAVQSIILSTADIFAQANPRFDRARFYAASGI